jgi:hypothetical protein
MNIEQLKQKLKPTLHTFEIETGITVQIHRPTQRDLPECKSLESTLVLCVKDENGDPVFSTEDVEGRINVNSIDFKMANKIYMGIMDLVSADKVDEIEKM